MCLDLTNVNLLSAGLQIGPVTTLAILGGLIRGLAGRHLRLHLGRCNEAASWRVVFVVRNKNGPETLRQAPAPSAAHVRARFARGFGKEVVVMKQYVLEAVFAKKG